MKMTEEIGVEAWEVFWKHWMKLLRIGSEEGEEEIDKKINEKVRRNTRYPKRETIVL